MKTERTTPDPTNAIRYCGQVQLEIVPVLAGAMRGSFRVHARCGDFEASLPPFRPSPELSADEATDDLAASAACTVDRFYEAARSLLHFDADDAPVITPVSR